MDNDIGNPNLMTPVFILILILIRLSSDKRMILIRMMILSR